MYNGISSKDEFIEKYTILTGKKLERDVNDIISNIKFKRNVVNKIKNLFNTEITRTRLISITGDRRRGKTTSMYQIMDSLITKGVSSDEIIFITFNEKDNLLDFSTELGKLILEDKFNPKYIFLDEVTDAKDFIIGLKFLSDRIKRFYNNIVVTGTWSQIFYELKVDKLLDRVILFELEQLTFSDNKKFLKRDIKGSIKNGMYIQDISIDITFEDCMDNLVQYLYRSIEYGENIYNITREDLMLFYFSLLYTGKLFSRNNLKEYNSMLNKYKLFSDLDINSPSINKKKVSQLVLILDSINQIVLRGNEPFNDGRYEIELLNKFEIIPKNITIRSFLNNDRNLNNILPIIFEDYLSTKMADKDRVILKFRNNEKEEIDIIDRKREMLIEVKMTDNWRDSYNKVLLDDRLLKEFEINEYSKNGVYLGETRKLDNGIMLWNIYDFERDVLEEEFTIELNKNYKEILDWTI